MEKIKKSPIWLMTFLAAVSNEFFYRGFLFNLSGSYSPNRALPSWLPRSLRRCSSLNGYCEERSDEAIPSKRDCFAIARNDNVKELNAFALVMAILFLFLFSGVECLNGSSLINIVTLPPKDNEIKGWIKEGGELIRCDDLSSLAAQINGAAPFYIEHGVRTTVFQYYVNSSSKSLDLDIYETNTSSEAKKLYEDTAPAAAAMIKRIGTEARIDESLIGVYMVELWKDKFYIKLLINSKTKNSRNEIIGFANEVAGKI